MRSITLLAGCAIAAVAVLGTMDRVAAQVPQAVYPLINDLQDASANNGPITLYGSPPPAQPANGVCINGIYIYGTTPGGQDFRTPNITSLDPNDFQISIEFYLTGLPTSNSSIFMAGNSYRWIGFYVQPSGTFGIKHNNSQYEWSTTTLTTSTWYDATIRYEAGVMELILDGNLVHQASIGPLNHANNFIFTPSDFSNGHTLYGCLRNIMISNDTTLGQWPLGIATKFGTGCDGLTLLTNSPPMLGNRFFEIVAWNVPATSQMVLFAFGTTSINPGYDLTSIGMAGCSLYSSFDIGVFGPASVVNGFGSLPIPIWNMPTLAGQTVSLQAVSLSLATTLGLASSNGMELTPGF